MKALVLIRKVTYAVTDQNEPTGVITVLAQVHVRLPLGSDFVIEIAGVDALANDSPDYIEALYQAEIIRLRQDLDSLRVYEEVVEFPRS